MSGLPAGKLTSPCDHGGEVVMGSPNTFITGLPAARIGDAHTCPIHSPGKIVSASTTVFINGVGAARQLDKIECNTAPSPATPTSAALMEGEADSLIGQWLIGASETKGDTTTRGGIVNRTGTKTEIGGVDLKVDGGWTAGYLKHSSGGGIGLGGAGYKSSWKASGAHYEKFVTAEANKNALVRGGVEFDAFTAETKNDVLLGSDGKRTGIVYNQKAGASVAGGKAFGQVVAPTGNDTSVDAKGEWKPFKDQLKALGGKSYQDEVDIQAYYDKNKGRGTLELNKEGAARIAGGAGAAITGYQGAVAGATAGAVLGPGGMVAGAILGASIGAVAGYMRYYAWSKALLTNPLIPDKVTISWGKAYAEASTGAGADQIAVGEPTVFIGD